MKSFYSILYCTIRPNQDERISIGLFLGNDKECFFDFSSEKLSIIRELLTPDAYLLLKSNLRSIKQLSSQCSNDILNAHMGRSSLSETYFSYLSQYANNLLTYSKPTTLSLESNSSIFNKLFEKLVFRISNELEVKQPKIEIARRRLHTSIKSFVNFDIEITHETIPGLAIPSKVAFIGKNKVEVAGELNDFNKASHFLKQQISSHLYFVEHLKSANKNAKFFYVGDEPKKSLKENHNLWSTLKDLNTVELVPSKEIEKIEQYMVDHGVTPLIT